MRLSIHIAKFLIDFLPFSKYIQYALGTRSVELISVKAQAESFKCLSSQVYKCSTPSVRFFYLEH